ncbi:MAG: glycosyl transferase [Phycisphaerae bacterium]|nr:glycosyl transferase [Phycisphaerae bacterium]
MGDFFQNGIITTLHDFGTENLESMENRLADILKRRDIALILPIIPRDLMSPAFNGIVAEIAQVPYISEVVLSLGQTDCFDDFVEARRRLRPLKQPHAVVWSSGPGIKKLFDELAEHYLDVGPDGKGRGVWTGIGYVLSNRKLWVITVHDCDIRNYTRKMLARLCYPCAVRGMDFMFTKAYYMRVTDRIYGRVTRLFVTPLIRAFQKTGGEHEFLSFLHSFRYPLSGEISMTRSLAHVMRMPGDWGLEIGTLSEVYRCSSLMRVCQVDIADRYEHKHQVLIPGDPKTGLLKMAVDIAKALLQTLASQGFVFPTFFFKTLQASYLQMAREAIDQYAADALLNGLPYDRHSEAKAIENFSEAIALAADHFQTDPTDLPRIPAWNRVMAAIPDFMERLSETVIHENRKADLVIIAERHREGSSRFKPDVMAPGHHEHEPGTT